LREKGVTVVLSGGAAVGIYTDGKYVSKDLDFINIYAANRHTLRKVLGEIGFQPEGRYF